LPPRAAPATVAVAVAVGGGIAARGGARRLSRSLSLSRSLWLVLLVLARGFNWDRWRDPADRGAEVVVSARRIDSRVQVGFSAVGGRECRQASLLLHTREL